MGMGGQAQFSQIYANQSAVYGNRDDSKIIKEEGHLGSVDVKDLTQAEAKQLLGGVELTLGQKFTKFFGFSKGSLKVVKSIVTAAHEERRGVHAAIQELESQGHCEEISHLFKSFGAFKTAKQQCEVSVSHTDFNRIKQEAEEAQFILDLRDISGINSREPLSEGDEKKVTRFLAGLKTHFKGIKLPEDSKLYKDMHNSVIGMISKMNGNNSVAFKPFRQQLLSLLDQSLEILDSQTGIQKDDLGYIQ